MSKCPFCNEEIILEGKQTTCHNCHRILQLDCWNCHETFKIIKKEDSKKLKECRWCFWWHCPSCNSCKQSCEGRSHKKNIMQKAPELTIENAQKIVDYFELLQEEKPHKECYREVPRTHAKKEIKEMLCRFEGKKTRDEEDTRAFQKRYEELKDSPLETPMTINQKREKGTFGKEDRIVLNLLVCEGKFYKTKNEFLKNGKIIQSEFWIRREIGICPYFNPHAKKLVKTCSSCGVSQKEGDICPDIKCVHKNNSKYVKKGDYRKLTEINSNIPTCKNLSNFKNREIKNGEREIDNS